MSQLMKFAISNETFEAEVKQHDYPDGGVAICPICNEELIGKNYFWNCKNGHNFMGPLL